MEDGLRCPLTSIQHHRRNHSLLVHIFVRGSSCRTIPSRALCSLLSPTFCCTYLYNIFALRRKKENKSFTINRMQIQFWLFVEENWKLTAFEACLMEFVSTSNTLFSCVHGFAAFWAFWVFGCYERHDYGLHRPMRKKFEWTQ